MERLVAGNVAYNTLLSQTATVKSTNVGYNLLLSQTAIVESMSFYHH